MERMISGIKPSGFSPTLGNYLGAIKPFIEYQNTYDLFVFIADLHALTVYQKPEDLQQNVENLLLTYLASGLDYTKCTIFKQSDIPAHTQLEWLLTCNTNLSDLTNMPQYKNYCLKPHEHFAKSAGLLLYPSLMNADILLYDAKFVPVGIDQIPHVELARDIAESFNKKYGQVFVLPTPVISKTSAKIMSLTNPTKKMSKSESDSGTIYLLDSIEASKKKIMKAFTDSENLFYFDPIAKPGLSNLITIYSGLTDMCIEDVVEKFKDCENYGVFKRELAEVLDIFLTSFQQSINKFKTENICDKVFAYNKDKILSLTSKKIDTIYSIIGLK